MNVLGIDPGMTGGFAWLSENSLVTDPMPVVEKQLHLPEIKVLIQAANPHYVYLEHVHAIFGSAAGATFKFGRVFGIIEGMLAGLGIPYILVSPKTWQKEMHEGCTGKKAKERSRLAVTRVFPAHDFTPTERATKAHDGMIDAALIAAYGRRRLNAS